ncbi:hypothetical protein, partial [Klebsiella michiganensis]
LRFSGPKTSIICSPMTSLKTSIKNITYLSDIGCLEIQGASLVSRYCCAASLKLLSEGFFGSLQPVSANTPTHNNGDK